jgi:transcriptional regulator of acetoin/glycerol metabolism
MNARTVRSGRERQLANVPGESSAHPTLAEIVRSSWTRCINNYALDARQTKRPTFVEPADLQTRRERLGAVLRIARIEMEGLAKLMEHSEYSIMLTDRDGVILSYVGDPAFSATARSCGFREGVVWSEREMGTNGMGTCLTTQRPIVIHRNEHFLEQNSLLTCAAAPIFDMRGELLAALDISGATSNTQTHTLALVDMAAQNVENRALLGACKRFHVVRFHCSAEFVSTSGEGVLAFDADGTITGANRGALALLGYHSHASLCGRRIDRILGTSLASLVELSAHHDLSPELLAANAGPQRWFVTVHSPSAPVRRAVAVPDTIEPPAAQNRCNLDSLRSTDPAMMQSLEILLRVVDRDIPLLLLGETGTGKGYCARAVHSSSRRAHKPFVAVNCAAIPEALIESELFGHRAGAFTGATRDGSIGRILQANGGTLFLDEVGDMPQPLQARLLNAIEEREIVPLGGGKAIAVDVRIISATQRNPLELIAQKLFREDLYYRLNGVTVCMPPLRQRTDCADVISQMLLGETASGPPVEIDPALLEQLVHYSWPGNIRQLRNVLRTMLALRSSNRLTVANLDDSWLGGVTSGEPPDGPPGVEGAADGDSVLSGAERDALVRTLAAFKWNVSAAATCLHLSRRTMYRKMHRHGLLRRAYTERASGRNLD